MDQFRAQPLSLLAAFILIAAVLIWRHGAGTWTLLGLAYLAGSKSAFAWDGIRTR